MKFKFTAILSVAGALAAALSFPAPNFAQQPDNRSHIVGGSVVATFLTEHERAKQIRLPHASVFLVRQSDRNTALGSALTDLSGRFLLKTQASGIFMLCVQADGFQRLCAQKTFTLSAAPAYAYGTFELPAPADSDTSAIAYGTVSLQDGSVPRGFDPIVDVNSYATVELNTDKAKGIYKAYVNNFGEFVVPRVPIKEDFTLRAQIDKASAERGVAGPQALAELQARHAYEFGIVLLNSPPRLRSVTAMQNGKRVQIAAPGSTVTLNAVADDHNGNKLIYRWLMPDGKVVGPTADPVLHYTLPSQRGSYAVSVSIGDDRGGYTRGGITIIAATGGVSFSGTVTDIARKPISGAQVDVNGRLINTNAKGWFNFAVTVQDKYIVNIRNPGLQVPNQPSYGTASFVYTAPVVDGHWTLRPAQVTSRDPTQPIVLQQQRGERDCIGPTTSRIDWSPYLKPGLFQWQDGRGNIRGLPDVGAADPKRVQNVLQLVAHINAGLVKPLSDITKVRTDTKTVTAPCTPGIKVEIGANALVDPSTNRAPSGNVQIALSSVPLSAPGQMPGDYTAQDSSSKLLSMESFGAGSIEIGAGTSRYNLKMGETATVTIPVDGTQLAGNASLPAKIPFLYYDEQAGVWHPDGEMDLIGSGSAAVYTKKVTHFSTMNADILKQGESCVAVEYNHQQLSAPFDIEVVMQPSLANPGVFQVRTLHIGSALDDNSVIYNLPNKTDIVLTPIVQGTLPDGTTGPKPAGVFVVNTGGPQTSNAKPPTPNADGTYYAEANGQPTGPCASRVTLTNLDPVSLHSPDEFLQGLSLQSSNVNEFGAAVATAIDDGVKAYYKFADPALLRNSFNLFKSQNKFGQPLGATEVETVAHYANGGDLGFGRDMHCRRNVASDGKFDYACYVTNFGQPPANNPDQQDAEDSVTPGKVPDATVAMEYSRVELAAPNDFPDNDRAVKFFVYNTNNPDGPPLRNADLDSHGARPVPQLCVICHGGSTATTPADINNPTGPTKGAFADRGDIMSMRSNFLPFDLHFFKFPAAEPSANATVQAAFKSLNVDIVKGVATANGTVGAAIVDVIDHSLYAPNGTAATQQDDKVVPGWDNGNANSPQNRFYRDVFARACRTCHTAQPYTAQSFQTKAEFDLAIATVQGLVCGRKVMPHAQRTNDLFWQSLNPNMPAYLQIYGQALPAWAASNDLQCGQFFQGGGDAQSVFTGDIYPIMATNCGGCHDVVGLANFNIGGTAATYNQLLTANTKPGAGNPHYIVPNSTGTSWLYHRITTGNQISFPKRMPQGGPDLVATDTNSNGVFDAADFSTWINSGAPGP
jgi:cytochrome c5